MAERTYTVQEIDALRRAYENKFVWGRYSGPIYRGPGSGGCSRSYRQEELTNYVEQAVRTSMLAGHTAQDLYDSEADPNG